jgi:hypothetical protein
MKTVRRLYFYAVAFVSLEVVLWGLIGLLRTIFNNPEFGAPESLAQALALILVGVPIFLVHWLWAQRVSARDEEEQTAGLRAVFLYGALLGTLVPVVQSLLALINRSLLGAARMSVERALLGGYQTAADNLIAIVMNLVVAAYFWSVLRTAWRTLPDRESFSDVRRLYRYLWVVYSLLLVVFGAQQMLRYIFSIPSDTLGELGREAFVNGLALLLVGTPVWLYSWRLVQGSLADPAENGSLLRLAVLYVLALSGVIIVLSTSGVVLNLVLKLLLGERLPWIEFVRSAGGPISLGLPFGALWAYYGHWLNLHIQVAADGPRRDGLRRPYHYILSFIGLVTVFIGVGTLISAMIDLALNQAMIFHVAVRDQLAAASATILVGLPLWLSTWRPLQTQAGLEQDSGDHARRSVVRKAYLYLVLFASVIGGMVFAVGLVFTLINALLLQDVNSDFTKSLLNFLQYLLLFTVVLLYHLLALRQDGASSADRLAEKQTTFPIVVFDAGDGGFAAALKARLSKHAAHLPVTVVNAAEDPPAGVRPAAVVLPGSLAVDPPESLRRWLREFRGTRLIVPDAGLSPATAGAARALWTQDADQAALAARALAEGQELRPQSAARLSVLTVVAYIFAALFALQLLLFLLMLGLSTISAFD